jgi:cytochrome c
MRNMRLIVLAVGLGSVALVAPAAAQRGTPAEAKAMLEKAIAHYNEVGRAQALADFTAKKAPFADRDLYVFCIDKSGKTSAHGALASYVGTSADSLKDADGKPLGKALIAAAAGKDGGAVRYRMMNPVSGKVENKVSQVRQVGTDVCGVGAYEGP